MRKRFPNLARELETEENKVPIDSVRTDSPIGEKATSPGFRHYLPDVVDFIRRCDTEGQAEEIVSYLGKRGEIDSDYACKLKNQLRTQGVRSFGPKKEKDYYLKNGDV